MKILLGRRWSRGAVFLKWEPKDMWLGVYWTRNGLARHVYICILPCLPLHIWWRPEASVEQYSRLFGSLVSQCANADAAEALSDCDLANRILSEVWAHLDMRSMESALLEAAIDRLKHPKGAQWFTSTAS